jgi:murein DD-endopeptidase MepM/ murein hydrolase activator NlpD
MLSGKDEGTRGRYMMHLLLLGLTLAAAAGAGLRTARGNSPPSVPEGAPTVMLAYVQPPSATPQAALAEVDDDLREFKLQRAKSVPTTAPRRTPAPTPRPTVTPTPQPTPDSRQFGFRQGRDAYIVYTIRPGDSLASIGKAFGMCPDHILWSNTSRGVTHALRPGDDLILPGYRGVVYKVRDGDTLEKIAVRYSTKAAMILAYPGNKLSSAGDIKAGKYILLPDGIPPDAFMQTEEAQWSYTHPSEYGYIWPFYGPITSQFGEARPGYVHYAIDIGGLYQLGTPVLAAASGRVETAESGDEGYSNKGYGNHVVIEHEDGSRTVYAHLQETYVEEDQEVEQGEPVGALGCTGHSTGTHLHFELYRNGSRVDPLQYLLQPD